MNNQPDSNCDHRSHNCADTLKKVSMAIDGAMNTTQEKTFLGEIQECSYCLEKYNIEKSFKSFLCAKVTRREVSADLVSSIRSMIDTARP